MNENIDYKEKFEKLKPFENEFRIPTIPIVDKDTYDNIIVPNLIRCGAIPKEELIVGKQYVGKCRNANVATWLGNEFEYMRYKFGSTFPEKINHFQDDNGCDVFVPINVL